jgi:hypothetical protein
MALFCHRGIPLLRRYRGMNGHPTRALNIGAIDPERSAFPGVSGDTVLPPFDRLLLFLNDRLAHNGELGNETRATA